MEILSREVVHTLTDDYKEEIIHIMGRDVFDKSFNLREDETVAINLLQSLFDGMEPDNQDRIDKDPSWAYCVGTIEDMEAYKRVAEDFIPWKNWDKLDEVFENKMAKLKLTEQGEVL